MAKVCILGGGSWGIGLSVVLHKNGHEVTVWSAVPAEIQMLQEKHEHKMLPGVKLSEDRIFTTDYKSAIDRLCEEEPKVEKRMMLEGTMSSGEKDLAVNDIVLTREGNLRIVQFNVYVNGTLLNTYQADGVIICTPTGSTGYNLSAGGPVVEPTASLIVITPICSHALNTSSVVLSAEDDVEVEICEGRYGRQEKVALCYDGAVQRQLVSGDRVKIRKSDAKAHLVKLSEESFMITMREKMKGN